MKVEGPKFVANVSAQTVFGEWRPFNDECVPLCRNLDLSETRSERG
jgi:hypothetical protein